MKHFGWWLWIVGFVMGVATIFLHYLNLIHLAASSPQLDTMYIAQGVFWMVVGSRFMVWK